VARGYIARPSPAQVALYGGRGLGFGPDVAAPVCTVAPVLAGTPTIGGTFTITPGTFTGTAPIVRTYTLRRAGVAIVGATGVSKATAEAYAQVGGATGDIGPTITVEEYGTNSAGVASAVSNGLAFDPETQPGAAFFGDAYVDAGSTLDATCKTQTIVDQWSTGNDLTALADQNSRPQTAYKGAADGVRDAFVFGNRIGYNIATGAESGNIGLGNQISVYAYMTQGQVNSALFDGTTFSTRLVYQQAGEVKMYAGAFLSLGALAEGTWFRGNFRFRRTLDGAASGRINGGAWASGNIGNTVSPGFTLGVGQSGGVFPSNASGYPRYTQCLVYNAHHSDAVANDIDAWLSWYVANGPISARTRRVLWIGDSITEGSTGTGPDIYNAGWRSSVRAQCIAAGKPVKCEGPMYGSPTRIVEFMYDRSDGIGAQDTGQWNAIDQSAMLASANPTLITCAHGVNDVNRGTSAATTLARMAAQIAILQAACPGVPIIRFTITQVPAFASVQAAVNAGMAAMVAGFTNVTLIDVNTGGPIPVGADNLHPTTAGYAQMATYIGPGVIAVLP
jgi:lysophospholipase L1-like esterase